MFVFNLYSHTFINHAIRSAYHISSLQEEGGRRRGRGGETEGVKKI